MQQYGRLWADRPANVLDARDRGLEIPEWVSTRQCLGAPRCFDRPSPYETSLDVAGGVSTNGANTPKIRLPANVGSVN